MIHHLEKVRGVTVALNMAMEKLDFGFQHSQEMLGKRYVREYEEQGFLD